MHHTRENLQNPPKKQRVKVKVFQRLLLLTLERLHLRHLCDLLLCFYLNKHFCHVRYLRLCVTNVCLIPGGTGLVYWQQYGALF